MSPEAPGNLVVLNLRFRGEELSGTIERVSPPQGGIAQGPLRVRFDARTKESGFYSVGSGVAWVSPPVSYVHSPSESAGKIPSAGDLQFYFNHVAYGDGLMLILIVPKGYTLLDSSPIPRGVKLFRNRITLYFKPTGRYGEDTRVTWKLRKLETNGEREVERIHKRILDAGGTVSHSGVLVDKEDPELPTGTDTQTSALDYGRMSLVSGLIGIGLLIFYAYEAKSLAPSVQSRIYFIVLLISALSCSIALFGILRSRAHITYKHYGTVVELSGAAALFALIVYYGSSLPTLDTFDLTVRVHSAEQSIITSGQLAVDIGSDRRVEAVNSKGEANFKRIPPEFAGTTVNILPEVPGYEEKPQECRIKGNVVDLMLVKARYKSVLRGTVEPFSPDQVLTVKVEGQDGETTVDKYGEFKLPVNARDGDRLRVRVFQNGKLVYDDYQMLPGPVELNLHKY